MKHAAAGFFLLHDAAPNTHSLRFLDWPLRLPFAVCFAFVLNLEFGLFFHGRSLNSPNTQTVRFLDWPCDPRSLFALFLFEFGDLALIFHGRNLISNLNPSSL